MNKSVDECSKTEIKLWYQKLEKIFNIYCDFDEFCKAYEEEYSKIYYYKNVVDFAHNLK